MNPVIKRYLKFKPWSREDEVLSEVRKSLKNSRDIMHINWRAMEIAIDNPLIDYKTFSRVYILGWGESLDLEREFLKMTYKKDLSKLSLEDYL